MKNSNLIPRFFIEQEIKKICGFLNDPVFENREFVLNDKDIAHQLLKVLRLRADDQIILLDNTGVELTATIRRINKKEIVLVTAKHRILKKESVISLNLVPAILKKSNLEFVLQKGTEIGVNSFWPIISERTEKLSCNFDRARKIIRESAEQSEKIFLPELHDVQSLENFLKLVKPNFSSKKLSLGEDVDKKKVEKNNVKIFALDFNSKPFCFSNFKKNMHDVFFLIGPEGGWGEGDLKLFEKFGIEKISIGSQILRAETAAIAISALMLLCE